MAINPNIYAQYLNQMPRGEKTGMLNQFTGNYDQMRQRQIQMDEQARRDRIQQEQMKMNALRAKAFERQASEFDRKETERNALANYTNEAFSNYGNAPIDGVGPMQDGSLPVIDRASAIRNAGASGLGQAAMPVVNTLFPDKDQIEKTSGQKEWYDLTKDLSEEDRRKARRIKLRLDPGAMGSASQTIVNIPGMTDRVAESEAVIKEKGKFAEMQGSQRSQVIDKSYGKVQSLTQNLVNLDNAIDAVKAGAGTGAITKRFPSIKQSSVLLDQVQGALALDVIGSVTFGALSEGELNLAKAIAIPTGLEGPELITWLQGKKAAQAKLLGYFKEQIDFLDQGGSVAGFLRQQERGAAPQRPPQGQPEQPQTTQRIQFDAQGNIIQ